MAQESVEESVGAYMEFLNSTFSYAPVSEKPAL